MLGLQQTFWLKVCIGVLMASCFTLGYALYAMRQSNQNQIATINHRLYGGKSMRIQESQIHKYQGVGYKIY